jgi:uncharacterized protein (TIGR02099 family)
VKRLRRRLWTTLVTLTAFLIVCAAVLSAMFRIAVREVPDYRSQMENWVSQALGHPARIGSIRLLWHIFEPVLEVNRVELLSAPGGETALRIDRIRIGVSPLRLLRGERMPDYVAVTGLQIGVHIDRDGKATMAGMAGSGGGLDLPLLLGDLERFAHIQLGRCRIKLSDDRLGGRPLVFDVTAAFDHERGYTRIKAQVQPPPVLAHALALSADVRGPLRQPNAWTVSWSVQAHDIAGWPWLQTRLPEGLKLDFRGADVDLSGRWAQGQLQLVQGNASAQSVRAVRSGDIVAQAEKFWISMRAQPGANDGWLVEFGPIQLTGALGPWPYTNARLRILPGSGGYAFEASGNFLRLDDIAPWLVLWPGLPPQLAQLQGDLSKLQFTLTPADADDRGEPGPLFTARAHAERLGVVPGSGTAGIGGIAGDVYADRNSGYLDVTRAPITLDIPDLYDKPLAMQSLDGHIAWHRDGGGWHIGAPDLNLRIAGTQAHGQLDLEVPADAEQSPRIDLSADFSSDDVTALKPLIPKTWGVHAREWLNRAIERGRAPQGHLELRGPLADYPYVERPDGRWQLDIDLTDVTLAFSRAWPAVQRVAAHLNMTGHGLSVRSDSADLEGVAAEQVVATIADLRGPELLIDIRTHGEGADYYRVLRESSLKQRLAGLLDSTQAHGPVQTALQVRVPLHGDQEEISANGTVRFSGNNSLDVAQLDEPVRDIGGALDFGADGIRAEALSGHFHDLTLSGRIAGDAASPDGMLTLRFDAPVEPSDGAFAAYVPAWVREQLTGSARWQAHLPLSGADGGHLTLNSDLRGVASRLPPPLQKEADETLPLTVYLGGDATVPLRILLAVREDLRLALRFAKNGPHLLMRGIEARLGAGPAPRADADGIVIDGSPDVFYLFKWLRLFGGLAGNNDAPALKTIDLTPASVDLGDFTLPSTHLIAKPAPAGWRIDADGNGARGVFQWLPANGGAVQARLDRLQLLPKPAPPKSAAPARTGSAPTDSGDESEDVRNVTDPSKVPLLDIQCEHLRVGEAELGRLALKTSRIADGQNFDVLRVTGGLLDADVHGPWQRAHDASSAAFDFSVATSDLAQVLKAFGYAPSLSGKAAEFSGHLAWADNPAGLQFKTAQGTIKMNVESGALNTIKPGAGRVLGLMNIYALPRRLTLNFSDVTSKGLGFDRLQGSFTLGGGNATTDDLEIRAPSLRMEMRGRIGLAARDYDERITVYPGVSSGVALGAGLLGGPAGAVIALVAQQLFSKPLDRLAQFSYHVSGSWDDPELRRGAEAEVPSSSRAVPAAPPATK